MHSECIKFTFIPITSKTWTQNTQIHIEIRRTATNIHTHANTIVNTHALISVAKLVLCITINDHSFCHYQNLCMCVWHKKTVFATIFRIVLFFFLTKSNINYIDQLDWKGKKNKIEIQQTIYFMQVCMLSPNGIELITWYTQHTQTLK